MKKHTVSFFSTALLLISLTAFILSPEVLSAGAKKGLSVCAGVIIPSLLPFLVLSSLASSLGLPGALSRFFAKPMSALFSVSGQAGVPFVLGLTGGYPTGAASVAQLVRDGSLDPREGERLLPFCSNTGPAFIIGAAGSGIFASGRAGLILYISHIAAAIAVGMLFSAGRPKPSPAPAAPAQSAKTLAEALPESIRYSVTTCLNICGYVIFFSVITALLDSVGLIHGLAGLAAAKLGAELGFMRSLLIGILELGSGIGSMAGLPGRPQNLALASFILGFGGLSVHCQTLAVISGTDMKCARHFAGRILHGLISALVTLALAILLRS